MAVVLKLHAVIAQSLRQCDRALLDDELCWVLDFGSMLASNGEAPTAGEDKDELSQLFQAVRGLPEPRQLMVLGVVRALLETVEHDEAARRRRASEQRRPSNATAFSMSRVVGPVRLCAS